MPPSRLVAFVAMLLAVQPLSTDLYLPSVPAMAQALGLSVVGAQGSFLAYLLGFALGQLPAGALSDRWGRRGVLVWAAAGYTLAALAGALAPNGLVLLVSRGGLGLCVAAMMVGGRAVVRDGFEPAAGERALAKGFAGMGVSAVLAGAVGGELAHALSWRAVMAVLAVAGAMLWAWTWWAFRPVPATQDAAHRSLTTTARRAPWQQILTHGGFWFSTLLAAISFTEAVCFVSGSAMVLPQHYGTSPKTLGWTLTVCSACFLVSTLACQGLLARWGGQGAMRWSSGISLMAAALFGQSSQLQGAASLGCLVAGQMCFMLGHGANQVCGQASAVAPFPDHAGLAAAWSGTLMILVSVVWGQAQSLWLSAAIDRMPWNLTVIAVFTSMLAWLQSRREAGQATHQGRVLS